MKRLALMVALAVAPLSVALVACGGDDGPDGNDAGSNPPGKSSSGSHQASSSSGEPGSSSGEPGSSSGEPGSSSGEPGSSSGDPGSSSGEPGSSSGQTGSSSGGSSSGNPGSSSGGSSECANGDQPAQLRIVAGNISSGNLQSYDPGHGIRIFKGLDVDVALVQEMNFGNNSASAIDSFVSQAFGDDFHWYRESGAQIPNGVVSRYPILASGAIVDPKVSNRKFVWARIDVPGPRELFAISVHFLTSSAGNRNAEAQALLAAIPQFVGQDDYVVLGGDFNTDSRSEAVVSTLRARFTVAAPYPVDENGKEGTNASRSKPYDWVVVDPALHALQVPSVYGPLSFPAGLVFDSRVFSDLNAVAPVQRADSGAPSMQHMAVVRDFRLPCEP